MIAVLLVLTTLVVPTVCKEQLIERHMAIIVPSRNNIRVCKRNLRSIFNQHYNNYEVIYFDDASDDGTAQEVRNYVTRRDQWHRFRLIENTERRGHMHNHFHGVHMCANDTVVVNLDGDDWFAHDRVLQKLNQAYADENIWMTYGQYSEYPYGKLGHCKPMHPLVITNHAYRAYDWVTSHLRTFYAGLFKQIPLGYFLYKDAFMPCAVDLAMMFAMMELSDGRIHFIDEVLYIYNLMNPDGISRNRVLDQLTMAYINRGREPLQPLNFDPRDPARGNISQPRIALVYFSDNNPEALQEFFDSWDAHGMIHDSAYVLYQVRTQQSLDAYKQFLSDHTELIGACVNNADLKKVLERMLALTDCTHILCVTDGCVMQKHCDIDACVRWLPTTQANGFFLSLGTDVTQQKTLIGDVQPPLARIADNLYAWKFKWASGTWRNPYALNGVLYTKEVFANAIDRCVFSTYAELQHAWTQLGIRHQEDVGLCYEQSALL